MKISSILCSPQEQEEDDPPSVTPARSPSQQPLLTSRQQVADPSQLAKPSATDESKSTFIPDNARKRPYRISAAQQQERREREEYNSRVNNLILDINELRRQIRSLMERRDLFIQGLVLSRQRFESDVLRLANTFLTSVRSRSLGLTPRMSGFFYSKTHLSQVDPAASGSVHQFSMQRGKPTFRNHSFTIKSIRVLAFVERGDARNEIAFKIKQVCGNDGGCVVEVVALFSGCIARNTIAALFPRVLVDAVLVSRLIGNKITFPSRLLLYFDTQRRLVQQIVQADLLAAVNAMQVVDLSEFAAVAGIQPRHE